MKLLLFDVDQTLISTGGAGIRALNHACRQVLSVENAMDGILPHGKTDPGIIREILECARKSDSFSTSLDAILEAYLTFLREEVETTSSYRVLPGILPLLDEMASRPDVLLGLATGNIERGARIKLERGNLNRYFMFGGYGSDSEIRWELVGRAAEIAVSNRGAILPQDVFVIGDTPLDIEAGRKSGFSTVGVATGKYSTSELSDSGATLVISDFEQGRDQFLRTAFIA